LQSFSNCSFKNINSTGNYCPTITISINSSPVNIMNCIFNNLKSNSSSINAGVFYLSTSISYSCSILGNLISDIMSSKSSIYLTGNPSKLSFSNNSFKNVECSSNGGV
jgi:ABC-type uncharacterized transport system permease subunit